MSTDEHGWTQIGKQGFQFEISNLRFQIYFLSVFIRVHLWTIFLLSLRSLRFLWLILIHRSPR